MPDTRRLGPEDYAQKARALWDSFNDSEKHGVRFGLFPFEKMHARDVQAYDQHALVVALMAHARQSRQEP